MTKRTVAVFTGNRSEYGLQYPVLRAIDQHPQLDYKLLVSGSHLDKNFGYTLDEIKKDGFHIDENVKIKIDVDSQFSTPQAIGSAVLSIGSALNKFKPAITLVYGDRFEAFAAVIASTQMNIPTAHVEGGDITKGGALDDSVRHAMTKLAHLHFTTNEQASNRILAMGEEPWRVHTVGFPAIDMISINSYATSEEVAADLSLDLNRPIVIFTQHSVTTEYEQAASQLLPSLRAIRRLADHNIQIILTSPNNDVGGQAIISSLKEIESESIPGIQVHHSLGRYLFHGILGLAKGCSAKVACVGNSSSGIKETPIFGCPTVNIGSRQEGRLRGENVIDVPYDEKEVYESVLRCFSDKEFIDKCRNSSNPYHLGDSSKKVTDLLASIPLDQKLIRKQMTLKGEICDGWYR